jgi:Xaa-Pro aminopeptidase
MFPTETYRKRRQVLMDTVSSGIILLMGNEDSPMNYAANIYPFRQDSSFLYYVGIDQPGLAVILDLDAGRTILFGTELTMDDIVWTGPQPSLSDRAARSGITETKPYEDLPAILAEANAGGRFVHILPPYRPENKVKLSAWLNVSFRQLSQMPSAALIKAVVAQRSVKEPAEIRQMEHAVDISGAMHVAAMEQARPGMRESQLVGIVQGIATAGGHGTAYPVIMTTQGQVLHNHHHHRVLQSGQLVLGDFGGATNMHYAGDITRTFPVDPTFTTQQKEIYEAVLSAQMEVIEAIKPGIFNRELHKMAALSMARSLKDLGLMKGDMEEAVEAGAAYLFFPHGLGHMIGLDVHDMEDLGEHYVGYADELTRSEMFGIKALRMGRTLHPGFVITVEPGLYFIPELIDQWAADRKHEDFINYSALAAYRDFSGVRIEDDILVTESGYRVLGDPIPKSVTEVESIREQVLTR